MINATSMKDASRRFSPLTCYRNILQFQRLFFLLPFPTLVHPEECGIERSHLSFSTTFTLQKEGWLRRKESHQPTNCICLENNELLCGKELINSTNALH